MFGDPRPKHVGYAAYIDEAGDPGIRSVAPDDVRGASEWFTVAAVVVRAENDAGSVEWVRKVREDLWLLQGPQLHFAKLNPGKRLAVCQRLAELDCRIFVVASHKPNMRGYTNDRAAIRGAQEPFYNWVTRILLERVTNYCRARSMRKTGRPELIRLDLSRRGGLNYHQMIAYHEYLRLQARPYLSRGLIAWDTLHPDLYNPVEAHQSAGVQIADIAASAFFQAAHARAPGWTTAGAEVLAPRMAREARTIANVGLTLMPLPPRTPLLTVEQRRIFEFYGYDFER